MTRREVAGAAFFFAAGTACLGSLPFFYFSAVAEFARTEPYYASPVPSTSRRVPIRNDVFGKGHYAASRGKNKSRLHKGIDVYAPSGELIRASKSGRVRRAEFDKGYGLWVEVVHPDGLASRYAHLQKILVRPGEWVARHSPVGLCGKTGNADEPRIVPHVHFEIRWRHHALNPSDGLLEPDLRFVPAGKN